MARQYATIGGACGRPWGWLLNLLGDLPPATFVNWRFLSVATTGGLVAFLFSLRLSEFATSIDVLIRDGHSLRRRRGLTRRPPG